MMARIIHEIAFWTAVPFMGLAEYAVLITIIWVRNLEVGMQRPLLGFLKCFSLCLDFYGCSEFA